LSCETAAKALSAAGQNRTPVAILRDLLGPTDKVGADAAQSINVQERPSIGARVAARKIGLNSEAVQRLIGADRPGYGTLFDNMEVNDDERLSAHRLIQPKVEAEITIGSKKTCPASM